MNFLIQLSILNHIIINVISEYNKSNITAAIKWL